MVTVTPSTPSIDSSGVFPAEWSLADLQDHLGGIPIERIRLFPFPGTATVRDAELSECGGRMICELIDGVLVEKTMGWFESRLAYLIGFALGEFIKASKIPGVVVGADGMIRVPQDQIRIPDVAFYGKRAFKENKIPREAAPPLVPDIAVEVLSPSNTKREMNRKLSEYFTSGASLVWLVDAESRTAKVFTGVNEFEQLGPDGLLDGGKVLPGFQLSLAELFAEAEAIPE